MTISLPDSLQEFVEQQVLSGAYPSAEAYLSALVEADLKQKGLERVEALILEGLDSGPPTEMTPQDWEDIRREGLARIRSRQRV